MPLHDFQCPHCEGIFETMLSAAKLYSEIACRYCALPMTAAPMLTGRPMLRRVDAWRPTSQQETLTGAPVTGPGTNPGASRSSVLHVCRGMNCSLCGT
ncbi:MAG: zinc ribbon domain-containing protein [Burkholderiales bacterium]|jgi:hypothetical protein|nr:zinc ribbon domain-containing protein [Burkholderiales bacterium]